MWAVLMAPSLTCPQLMLTCKRSTDPSQDLREAVSLLRRSRGAQCGWTSQRHTLCRGGSTFPELGMLMESKPSEAISLQSLRSIVLNTVIYSELSKESPLDIG